MEHAIICPQCNAPLTPHRFARMAVCAYCGTTVQLDETSLSAAIFHESFRLWNTPTSYSFANCISLGERHWALERLIAHGSVADVYTARRARWPTELVLVKVLRDKRDGGIFDHEWNMLQSLQQSNAPGADLFLRLVPQPVLHGDISAGLMVAQRVSIFRWASGFYHTFEEIARGYPQGIPPQASIWVWRRILELLSFLHASGMVHGAVLPPHLLTQENEHGVRLVGYNNATLGGDSVRSVMAEYESYYPSTTLAKVGLSSGVDLIMSARCIISILGGDPVTGDLPATVPAPLAATIRRVALSSVADADRQDAWALREELGRLAGQVFGPPRFLPIMLPA